MTRNLDITVSPILQQNATPEDLAAHIDIADWHIRTRCKPVAEPVKEHCEAFLKAVQFVDPKYHAALEGLIEDFDLEFWGVVKIEPECHFERNEESPAAKEKPPSKSSPF